MKRISFTSRNRSGNLLHIETDLGIINVRVGLHTQDGRPAESISVSLDPGVEFAPGEAVKVGSAYEKAGQSMRLLGPKE